MHLNSCYYVFDMSKTVVELRIEAKNLNIPYSNLNKEELEKAIAKASVSGDTNTNEVKKDKNNTAHVKRGPHIIRTYTLEQHGEDFEEMAKEYAKNNKYKVDVIFVAKGITCPQCGEQFMPKK